MEPIDHPFLDIASELENPYLRQAKINGKKIIGYFCSYMPRELLDAGGLAPFRMRASNTTLTEVADTYLGVVNCSYTRCLLEAMFNDTLDFVDGYAFVASCDHLRRLYDNLRYLLSPQLCHILDLPHKMHEDAVDWYTQELDMFRTRIANTLGVSVTEEQIEESIRRTNELRQILRMIQELRKGPEPKLTGEEMHRIMIAVNSTPADAALKALKEIYPKLKARRATPVHRARLLIMGSQMDDPAYIAAMEQMGALIVGEAFCEGPIQFMDMVEEDGAPMTALAKRYLRKLSCPRMFEAFDERYGRVVNAFKEYQADGIVLATMKFCDTWGIDAPLFINRLRDQGIQVLRLEREYTLGGVGQLRTRVQAFIEMLGR
jgi:benzoyl-CoA reductase/2-hydroxyglutaryl-CoA dehydratase subunit BcrC/BadD/HgdB